MVSSTQQFDRIRKRKQTTAGKRNKRDAQLVAIRTGVDGERAVGDRAADGLERGGSSTGDAEVGEVGRGDRAGIREAVGQTAVGRVERLAQALDQSARQRARAGDRDLLTQDRAHRKLGTVDVTGHPAPGRRADSSSERAVAREEIRDRLGVGVQVEQATRSVHRGGEI